MNTYIQFLLFHEFLPEPMAMYTLCTSPVFKQVHDTGNEERHSRVKGFHHNTVISLNLLIINHNSTGKKHINLNLRQRMKTPQLVYLFVVLAAERKNCSLLFYKCAY